MKKKIIPSLFFVILTIIVSVLLVNDNTSKQENEFNNFPEIKALVLETDDSNVIAAGLSSIGDQTVTVEILEGDYKGQSVDATNHLFGDMEIDNFYRQGDKIIIAIMEDNGQIVAAKTVDMYRQGWEMALFITFFLCLILYAGYTGLKVIFSFVASLFVIWKILIPGLLEGRDPLLLASFVLVILTIVIIFSVAGFTRTGFSAFAGTIFGLIVTIFITMFFWNKMGRIENVQPYSQTLLFSGHLELNMQFIFYAAIIIGASGAAMDISMDVASAMNEVKLKKPDITVVELIKSGFNVGRAVIGTMATTLLLAYSGGYLTLLMLFMTKNSSIVRILNLKIFASEIMRIVVGSIGLFMVAPITALVGGWVLCTDFKGLLKKKESN